MAEDHILIEITDGVKVITINRPKALNALNEQVVTDLENAIVSGEADDQVHVMVITGTGRAFVAGADIIEMVGKDGAFQESKSHHDHECFLKIVNCTKPVIAAVNGFALGGGCELAMCCHITVASENAFFGQPEINIGAIPGAGGTQNLPRLIGKGPALYYLLTGENITAQDAYRLGLVTKLARPDEVMVTAMAIARVIARKAPIARRLIMEAVNQGVELDLKSGFRLEEKQWRICGDTEDCKNAMRAFYEKKPIVFQGK
jgi:enoyl-CoA hydratase